MRSFFDTYAIHEEPEQNGPPKEQEKWPEEEQDQEAGSSFNESYFFLAIVLAFVIGVGLLPMQYTGNAVLSGMNLSKEVVSINQMIIDNTTMVIPAKGEILSIRITGTAVGQGAIKVMANGHYILDETPEEPNLITANVVMEGEEASGVDPVLEDADANISDAISPDANSTGMMEETQDAEPFAQEPSVQEPAVDEPAEEFPASETLAEEYTESAEDTEIFLDIRHYDEHCQETCYLRDGSEQIDLIIVPDGAILNLTSISYIYASKPETDSINSSVIELPLNDTVEDQNYLNESFAGDSPETNMTPITDENESYSVNLTQNITGDLQNLSFDLQQNMTGDGLLDTPNETEPLLPDIYVENSTEISLIENGTLEGTTEFTENSNDTMTDLWIMINETENVYINPFDAFNISAQAKRYPILAVGEMEGRYFMSVQMERGLAEVRTQAMTGFDLTENSSEDSRIASNIYSVQGQFDSIKLDIQTTGANKLLECVQYDEMCMKWKEKAAIPYASGRTAVTVREAGIYALAYVERSEISNLAAKTIYYNSNCDKCSQMASCEPDDFCVMQNKLSQGFDFVGQLGFDLLKISEDVVSAEICAKIDGAPSDPVMNYLKYSEKGYCGDLREHESISDMITYKMVYGDESWVCMDATIMVKDSLAKGYSDIYLDWIGQDLANEASPYACYVGLEGCDSQDDEGGCRPYMRLTYR
jgi:hypothetical protein